MPKPFCLARTPGSPAQDATGLAQAAPRLGHTEPHPEPPEASPAPKPSRGRERGRVLLLPTSRGCRSAEPVPDPEQTQPG